MVALNHEVTAPSADKIGVKYDPIPPGSYQAEIDDVQVKESNNKPGNSYLEIVWKLDDNQLSTPQPTQRLVWDKIYLWYDKPNTVSMAKERLSSLGRALGMTTIADTDHLWQKRATLEIDIQTDNPQYNEVKSYGPANAPAATPAAAAQSYEAAPTPAPAQTEAPLQPTAPATDARPWNA
jgi:hypothetical protein